jgi:hypothetical protein
MAIIRATNEINIFYRVEVFFEQNISFINKINRSESLFIGYNIVKAV